MSRVIRIGAATAAANDSRSGIAQLLAKVGRLDYIILDFLVVDPALSVPTISLAWARSGDKGNLFSVAVIARDPDYLPYIAAALTTEIVSEHSGRVLEQGGPLPVDRFSVPGLGALNFVVMISMEGGVLAPAWIDPIAKGMAQVAARLSDSGQRRLVQEAGDLSRPCRWRKNERRTCGNNARFIGHYRGLAYRHCGIRG